LQDVRDWVHDHPDELGLIDDESGDFPLLAATVNRNLELVKLLLELGADPMQPDRNGMSCMKHVMAIGDIGILRAFAKAMPLLDAAMLVRPNPSDKGNKSLLEFAVVNGNPVVLLDLLRLAKTDGNIRDSKGCTPLVDCIVLDKFLCLWALLYQPGIRLDDLVVTELNGGTTLLHLCMSASKWGMFRALLQAGASPDVVTADGTIRHLVYCKCYDGEGDSPILAELRALMGPPMPGASGRVCTVCE
jgi:ankyrin repeat protein